VLYQRHDPAGESADFRVGQPVVTFAADADDGGGEGGFVREAMVLDLELGGSLRNPAEPLLVIPRGDEEWLG
jgi:hypothetical protein